KKRTHRVGILKYSYCAQTQVWRGFQPIQPQKRRKCFMLDRFTNRFVVLSALFSLLVFASSLSAQSVPAVAPLDNLAPAEKSLETETPALNKDDFFVKGFAHQLGSDQKAIWTSPAHIQASDAKWLVPLAAGTTVLLFEDTKISHAFDGKTSVQNTAEKVG